jgi:integrase
MGKQGRKAANKCQAAEGEVMKEGHVKRGNPRGLYEKEIGSGDWWIRYKDAKGKKRREHAGTKSSAIKLYSKRKTEALQGKKLPETLRGREVKFAEIADSGLEYSKLHKRSYRMDKSRMAVLKRAFGNCAADSITPQDIQKWIADDLSEHSPATQNRYRALLCLVYRLAMENGRVTVNPARLVRQKPENNGRIRFLSPEEETRLRTALTEKFAHRICELDFALNVGLRKANQYDLTWNDIDFERRMVTVGRSKNGSPLHLPLNDSAIAALRAAQRLCNGSPSIFLNRVGDGLRDNRHWFDTAKKEAKIKGFRWHDLRHTFISRLVNGWR